MKGYLYRYNTANDEAALAQIIQQQPLESWIYLENDYPLHDEYAVHLKFRRDAVNPEQYSVGRIFNEDFEVRWQRQADGAITTHLLCERELDLQDEFMLVETFDVDDGSVFLWGTHTSYLKHKHDFIIQANNIWLETRIPRPLEYPLPNAVKSPYVHVKTRRYYQLKTGISYITRWLAIEESD